MLYKDEHVDSVNFG